MSIDVALHSLIPLALEEDLGNQGDITSRSTIDADKYICGEITAKANGVIAGLRSVELVYQAIHAQVEVVQHAQDGDQIEKGDLICSVTGNAYAVLAGERTALNFLQRLSGIATLTRQYVKAVEGTHSIILDTRKTHPGWRLLDKYAVRMGGGQNHRMGLYDMVLIKDNHIEAAGGITAAINAVRRDDVATNLPIIVEVKDEDELIEALQLKVDRILLDNMDLPRLRRAVEIANGRVPLEASGNVNLNTVRDIALTGVKYISVGTLTHSAPVLDLSMRLTDYVEK